MPRVETRAGLPVMSFAERGGSAGVWDGDGGEARRRSRLAASAAWAPSPTRAEVPGAPDETKDFFFLLRPFEVISHFHKVCQAVDPIDEPGGGLRHGIHGLASGL